jgi:hypothetical protein
MQTDEAEAYAFIRWADGGCVARFVNSTFYAGRYPMLQGLPDPGPCRNAAGEIRSPYDESNLTNEHVKDELGMSLRATSDREHLVRFCWGHHVFGQQWCTMSVVREAIRAYIAARDARHPNWRLAGS